MEDEGLATVQISLIREHTEKIKPPRALWVPFELGRPLGVPNDPDFQRRVLLSALKLLEAAAGPVLEDFPEEAPHGAGEGGPLACPVNFQPVPETMSTTDQLLATFEQEVSQLRNWYDLALQTRGRTTAGITGLTPAEVAEFIAAFVRGQSPEHEPWADSLPTALRMAVEDLKAYYLEAVSAQPGQPTDSAALADWFWGRTAAAQVIHALKQICLERSEKGFALLGKLLLVPRTQEHRFKS